tara:strand:+ start:66 stop:1499 length:1434 start_codon:yes stop_codon:yes gene_type:complete
MLFLTQVSFGQFDELAININGRNLDNFDFSGDFLMLSTNEKKGAYSVRGKNGKVEIIDLHTLNRVNSLTFKKGVEVDAWSKKGYILKSKGETAIMNFSTAVDVHNPKGEQTGTFDWVDDDINAPLERDTIFGDILYKLGFNNKEEKVEDLASKIKAKRFFIKKINLQTLKAEKVSFIPKPLKRGDHQMSYALLKVQEDGFYLLSSIVEDDGNQPTTNQIFLSKYNYNGELLDTKEIFLELKSKDYILASIAYKNASSPVIKPNQAYSSAREYNSIATGMVEILENGEIYVRSTLTNRSGKEPITYYISKIDNNGKIIWETYLPMNEDNFLSKRLFTTNNEPFLIVNDLIVESLKKDPKKRKDYLKKIIAINTHDGTHNTAYTFEKEVNVYYERAPTWHKILKGWTFDKQISKKIVFDSNTILLYGYYQKIKDYIDKNASTKDDLFFYSHIGNEEIYLFQVSYKLRKYKLMKFSLYED